jgi:hypothetical protein
MGIGVWCRMRTYAGLRWRRRFGTRTRGVSDTVAGPARTEADGDFPSPAFDRWRHRASKTPVPPTSLGGGRGSQHPAMGAGPNPLAQAGKGAYQTRFTPASKPLARDRRAWGSRRPPSRDRLRPVVSAARERCRPAVERWPEPVSFLFHKAVILVSFLLETAPGSCYAANGRYRTDCSAEQYIEP